MIVWWKIAKFNFTNIKSPWFGPACWPLQYIQLCTSPALEDSCILPRECDIGYSLLSGKEFCVANEHALGAADLGQLYLQARTSKYKYTPENRAKMERCANETAFSQLEITSYQFLINHDFAHTLLHRSGDWHFGVQRLETPNSNSPIYKIWHSGWNLIPTKFSHYTVIALRGLNVAHRIVIHERHDFAIVQMLPVYKPSGLEVVQKHR